MSKACPVPKTRARIITAAMDLATARGPLHVSIEAVAERAGLSKGGVLYHFPTKADLLVALVGRHIERADQRIERQMPADGQNRLARALVAAYREELSEGKPDASGLLAVLAEYPDLLDPVRAHQQDTLDLMWHDSRDPELAALILLALEGMRALDLFGFDILAPAIREALLGRMTRLLSADMPADGTSGATA